MFSWTGCYAGGNAGWIGSNDRIEPRMSGDFLAPGNLFADPANRALLEHQYRSSGSGFSGGVQVGCNYQINNWVWGVEADFQGSTLKETIDASYGPAPTTPGLPTNAHTEHLTTGIDWFSTIRGRAGVTWDRLLIYATGGLAIARVKASTDILFAGSVAFLPNNHFVGSQSETRTGFAVGGGLEYAFGNNWSMKAEYLYLDFGTFNYLAPDISGVAGPTSTWTTDVSPREHVVRVGLNYKFY